MEAHIDFKLVGQVVAFILMALMGGIAWGKLNERVKKHDVLAEGCHLDDYVKRTDCADAIADCPGATHAAETHRRVIRIESDLTELKTDLRTSDAAFHQYQVDQGAAMARIETNINTLLDVRGLPK